jgi:hypothetical protein
MGSRVLSPVQFARVHLETYPAGVDVVALTKCGSRSGSSSRPRNVKL